MVIFNKFIPFKGFCAINLFTLIFVRSEYKEYFNNKLFFNSVINHENIHSAQQKELLFIFFYVIYLIEWLFNLVKYRNADLAYSNISFEKEAYKHEFDLTYLKNRKPFAMWRK